MIDELTAPRSVSEVCDDLGVSRLNLWRWGQAGLIPQPERINRRRSVYKPEDVLLIAAMIGSDADA